MSNLFALPKIIAIGGAGIKIATRLKQSSLGEYDVLAFDLGGCSAPFEVVGLGGETLGLLGSGGDPEVTRTAVEANRHLIEERLQGVNFVFIVAGLGGGTASALAPIVAAAATKAGAFVVSLATLPFGVEGSRRMSQAREGLAGLRQASAVTIPLPNDTLLQLAPAGSAPGQTLELADSTIARTIRGLTAMVCAPGILEVDFATLKKTFAKHSGKSLLALGEGIGSGALSQAFNGLASFPFLSSGEVARHADHLIISIKASGDIGLKEINELKGQLADKFGARGEHLVAATIEPSWTERVEVMLIGLPDPEARKKQVAALQAAANAARAARTKAAPTPNPQAELGFSTLIDQRGFFESNEQNMYRSEDVDLPAYLRRGVKLVS